MKLRHFLYLNTKLLNDYLSAIDGYVYDVERRTESHSTEKAGGLKLGIPVLKGDGQVGEKANEEITREVQISDAAKFDKVFNYLSQDNEVKFYEIMNEAEFSQLLRDDFFEVFVTPRFSRKKEMADSAKKLGELAEILQPFSGEQFLDEKSKTAIEGFAKLDEIKDSKGIACVLNFEDEKYPIVTYLDEQCFKVEQDQFVGQVNVLCKIQRKLSKGQNIELDEMFEGVKTMATNRAQRRKLPKDMKNPEIIKDVIRGPAFLVIPIAIYQ